MYGLPAVPAPWFLCLIVTTMPSSTAFQFLAEYRTFHHTHQRNAQIVSSILASPSLHPCLRLDGMGYSKCTVTVTRMAESSTKDIKSREKHAASSSLTPLDGAKDRIKTSFRKPKGDGRPYSVAPEACPKGGNSLNTDILILAANISQSEPGLGTIKRLCHEADTKGMDLR
jgi:hypothetical protein